MVYGLLRRATNFETLRYLRGLPALASRSLVRRYFGVGLFAAKIRSVVLRELAERNRLFLRHFGNHGLIALQSHLILLHLALHKPVRRAACPPSSFPRLAGARQRRSPFCRGRRRVFQQPGGRSTLPDQSGGMISLPARLDVSMPSTFSGQRGCEPRFLDMATQKRPFIASLKPLPEFWNALQPSDRESRLPRLARRQRPASQGPVFSRSQFLRNRSSFWDALTAYPSHAHSAIQPAPARQ